VPSKKQGNRIAIYRQARTLTPLDAAYIAGVIDGEGTISLSRRHKTDNRQLVISISNTEPELLEYVLRVVGAGRITKKQIYSVNHTPSVTYVIDNRQALSLLEQIAPYLRTYKKNEHSYLLVLRDASRHGEEHFAILRQLLRGLRVLRRAARHEVIEDPQGFGPCGRHPDFRKPLPGAGVARSGQGVLDVAELMEPAALGAGARFAPRLRWSTNK